MRFSWLVLPVVAVTLTWRLAIASEPLAEDRNRMLVDISAALAEQGFTTRIDWRDGPDAVFAARAGCALVVAAEIPSQGGFELFNRRYGAGRTVVMFYHSAFVAEFPRWRMAWTYYLQRHLAPYGFELPYPPLVLIAAGAGCNPGAIDWGRLRFHPLPQSEG